MCDSTYYLTTPNFFGWKMRQGSFSEIVAAAEGMANTYVMTEDQYQAEKDRRFNGSCSGKINAFTLADTTSIRFVSSEIPGVAEWIDVPLTFNDARRVIENVRKTIPESEEMQIRFSVDGEVYKAEVSRQAKISFSSWMSI